MLCRFRPSQPSSREKKRDFYICDACLDEAASSSHLHMQSKKPPPFLGNKTPSINLLLITPHTTLPETQPFSPVMHSSLLFASSS